MTCTICSTEHTHPKGEEMQVCWCRIDICSDCVEAHIASCKWAKAMEYKPPEKQMKAKKFPRIGQRAITQF